MPGNTSGWRSVGGGEHPSLLLPGLTGAGIGHPAAPRLPFAHDSGQHAPKWLAEKGEAAMDILILLTALQLSIIGTGTFLFLRLM